MSTPTPCPTCGHPYRPTQVHVDATRCPGFFSDPEYLAELAWAEIGVRNFTLPSLRRAIRRRLCEELSGNMGATPLGDLLDDCTNSVLAVLAAPPDEEDVTTPTHILV